MHTHKIKETMVKRDKGPGNRNLTEEMGENRRNARAHSRSMKREKIPVDF